MTTNADTLEIALQHHQAGRLEQAERLYEMVLKNEPDHPAALHSLGIIAYHNGRSEEAVSRINKAIAINPHIPQFHNNIGAILKSLGRSQQAIDSYRQAISLKPDYAEAYSNLASVLFLQGRYDDAVDICSRAIQIAPDHAPAYNNMAAALHSQGKYAAAVEKSRQAIRLKPDYAEAYNTLGSSLQKQGCFTEAIENYIQALRLDADYAEVHDNLAMILLLNGEFAQGWKEFEWRQRAGVIKYRHLYDIPRWDGCSFAGKRLLVHYEQGFGDSLQFARYLPMVKQRGGTVIYEEKKPLIKLLGQIKGVDELIIAAPDSRADVKFDFHVPLLSLAMIFGTTLETIPVEVPYLYADPEKVKGWRDRFDDGVFKVGIVWAGFAGHKNDHNRSCALEKFLPLAEIEGVQLYGLQKDKAAAEVNNLPQDARITNFGDQLEDFTDTAAAIENLDLLISVDTSVVHLAGAMGKLVWNLLPFAPDWRWMLDRQDSPWYPSMRLFRQEKQGDWDELFQRVKEQLQILMKKQMVVNK